MDSLPPLDGLAGGDVGDELAAILQSVAEISVTGGPKFAPAVCRRLARWIVCRSYGGPLRELCHLVRIAERSFEGQGFESLFWEDSAATAASFRRRLAPMAEMAAGLRPTETGLAACYPDGTFAVAYTRMPFLAALMEFLASVIGYGELDALFRAGPEARMSRKSVDAMANDLARLLYAWLASQLPTAQSQRKFRAVVSFLRRTGERTVRAEHIDDDTVLAFWIFTATDDAVDGDYRSFRTVFHLMVGVRDALAVASAHMAMVSARSIGGDRSAGEVDPGVIDASAVDAALGAMHERCAPLEVLAAPPASDVKFLKRTEADALDLIVRAGDVALALPLSVLRVQVFGAVQARISQALRRGDRPALAALIDGVDRPAESYAACAAALVRMHAHLEQMLLASLHCLLQAGHEEAITIMLYLRPQADLSPLAALFDADDDRGDSVVRLKAPVGERFVNAVAADPSRCPALAGLLREAAAAARRTTRKGFQQRDEIAPFAVAVEALIALRQSVGRLLGRLDRLFGDPSDWERQWRADRDVFQAQFGVLYGDR